MALTPEQVLNKQFQTTQFRKGYDERDVDDFLDEIVAELRSIIAQRDDFKTQLDDCRAGRGLPPVADPDTAAATASGQAEPVDTAEHEQAQARLEELRNEIASAQNQLGEVNAQIAQAQQEAAAAAEGAATVGGAPDEASGSSVVTPAVVGGVAGMGAAGLIELAQRVHDEHVAKGQARHDELLAEAQARHDDLLATGQSRHDELVGSAQTRHDELVGTAQARHDELLAEARERSSGMVAEAQSKREQVLGSLLEEQRALEGKLEALRGYERTYRAELRKYFQGKLAELDGATGEATSDEPLAGEGADGSDGDAES